MLKVTEFQITVTVVPVTPKYFVLAVDPPSQTVDGAVVAEFLVSLSGDYTGRVDLTIEGVPEGAVAEFDARQHGRI